MQSLTGKSTGDSLTAVEWNQLPQEVQNVITLSGQTLSSGDLQQLIKAIKNLVATGDYYTDSGTADTYLLTGTLGPLVTTLYDGLRVRFIPDNAATGGAATIKVGALATKPVTRPGAAALQSGIDLVPGVLAEATFDATADAFILRGPPAASTTEAGILSLATTAEINAGVNTTKAVTPAALAASTIGQNVFTFRSVGIESVDTDTLEVQPYFHEVFSMDPGGHYAFEAYLGIEAAAGGLVLDLSSAGSNIDGVLEITYQNSSGNTLVITDSIAGVASPITLTGIASAASVVQITGRFFANSGGSVLNKFYWSQETTSAPSTLMRSSSWIRFTKFTNQVI